MAMSYLDRHTLISSSLYRSILRSTSDSFRTNRPYFYGAYINRSSVFMHCKFNRQKSSMRSAINASAASFKPSSVKTSRINLQQQRPKSSSSPETAQAATAAATTATPIKAPTSIQLRRVFYRSALPMIGFGIMDQTVMLHAGHAIDCTLGVTFGLSTLTAAAFGQVCSDASGVLFGNTLDQLASRVGLPRSGLDATQRALPIVQRTRFMGALLGVIFGCMIGLLNLLIIDTDRSSTLKLRAFNEEQEFEFLVEASNAIRNDATALTVTGPDVDGILASMTAALALRGCSLVELHAKRKVVSDLIIADVEVDTGTTDATARGTTTNSDEATTSSASGVQDIFYVVDRLTGKPFDDDELHDLAQSLLEATRTPMNAIGVKAVIHELEKSNHALKQRVHRLEAVVKEKQIRVVPTPHDENYEPPSLVEKRDSNHNQTFHVPEEIKS
jgi:hypothetical protein